MLRRHLRTSSLALASFVFIACSGEDDPDVVPPLPLDVPPLPLDLAPPPAPAVGSVCDTAPEGVTTIERPMFPDAEGSPTFGYSFKRYPGTDPEAPTIIFLPGGPGQNSIEAEREVDFVPPEYTVIQTDPRGTGCNAPESAEYYPDEFYRSVHFADDVIAIVEALALDDYVVYGISYGTLLATIVASRLEQRGLPLPRGLVLEGVVGEAFTPSTPATEAAFQERWRVVRDSLDDSIRSQLVTEPLPLGLTGEQWGAGLVGLLPLAATPESQGVDLLYLLLQALRPEPTEGLLNLRMQLPMLLEQAGALPFDERGLRLFEEVSCKEIAEDDYSSLALEGGELVVSDYHCDDTPLSDPFAAADWPVHAPIYYFSGTVDTNTPPWQARSHFEAETTAPRQLVHLIEAGHNPLQENLDDCAAPLWQAMTSGGDIEAALGTCEWPLELESAGAR